MAGIKQINVWLWEKHGKIETKYGKIKRFSVKSSIDKVTIFLYTQVSYHGGRFMHGEILEYLRKDRLRVLGLVDEALCIMNDAKDQHLQRTQYAGLVHAIGVLGKVVLEEIGNEKS